MDVSPLLLSVWVAACATFFSVVLGTLAAYGVMKLRRLRPFADAVLTLPLVLPPTVTGFFLLILLVKTALWDGFSMKSDFLLYFPSVGRWQRRLWCRFR